MAWAESIKPSETKSENPSRLRSQRPSRPALDSTAKVSRVNLDLVRNESRKTATPEEKKRNASLGKRPSLQALGHVDLCMGLPKKHCMRHALHANRARSQFIAELATCGTSRGEWPLSPWPPAFTDLAERGPNLGRSCFAERPRCSPPRSCLRFPKGPVGHRVRRAKGISGMVQAPPACTRHPNPAP